MKDVLVFGTFDVLHPGHLFVLSKAAEYGRVTVIVARDKNVKRIKGKEPVEKEQERLEAIRRKFPDATVTLGDRDDFLEPLRSIRPDIIVLGYDQKLPPGVFEVDLAPAEVVRLTAHQPERFKSTLLRKEKKSTM